MLIACYCLRIGVQRRHVYLVRRTLAMHQVPTPHRQIESGMLIPITDIVSRLLIPSSTPHRFEQ